MCGLTAIFAYRDSALPVDGAELVRIREAMLKRGPDGEGLWISDDKRVGLAHRRLAIIDLSEAGVQPMSTTDGKLRIVFNGEIYNYRELRAELEKAGHRFISNSDTEVLLHLYRRHGRDMVRFLRGMYAFALWDTDKRGLFLARDPFGVKPLYYSDDGGTIRVASQVKALLKGGKIDATPEPAGHVGFLLWGYVPGAYTLYKGIRGLEAGTTLWVDTNGRKEFTEFFSVTEELAQCAEISPSLTLQERHERLRAALLDSVRCHLIADVPVGVFLSAGLDSTTLTALAKEVGSTDLRTVTLGFKEFEGTNDDEVPMAEFLAGYYGTVHQSRWVTGDDFQSEYEVLLDAMDQPSVDGVNSYFVSKAASDAGLKVVLSGVGGDELFGGYPSFRQIPSLVTMLGALPFARTVGKGFRYISAAVVKRFTSPKYAGLLEYGTTFGDAFLLRRGLFMPWELPSMLEAEVVRQGWEELQTLSRLKKTIQGVRSARSKVVAMETVWYMRNMLLRDTDWASMAHSLEIRVPLVDVELFRSLVPLLGTPEAPTKVDMARTPRLPLPDRILHRRKSGFSIPVAKWTQIGGAEVVEKGLRQWAASIYRSWHVKKAFGAAWTPPTVLVYRIGQLGDTLVALPAIETIRQRFPGHRLMLLTDRHSDKVGYVSSWDVLGPTGFFDDVIYYEHGARGWSRLAMLYLLLFELRDLKIDHFFVLTGSRSKWQGIRDRWYFSIVVRRGGYHAPASVSRDPHSRKVNGKLFWEEPEWRHLLRKVNLEPSDDINFHLPVPEDERGIMRQVALSAGVDLGAMLLAVGPGSKMPAKIWPSERFAELGVRLQNDFPDLRLLVLGSNEDTAIGRELCGRWGGRAHNLAGMLSVFGSAAMLEQCLAYVGNDTGTMHLAGMAGAPCVALFSARDNPGKWEPYGKGHVILRRDDVECAGCMLEICNQHDNKCLKLIGMDEVYAAVRSVIESRQDWFLNKNKQVTTQGVLQCNV